MLQAIARLERLPEVIAGADPWPGDLWGVALPGGNGAALSHRHVRALRRGADRLPRRLRTPPGGARARAARSPPAAVRRALRAGQAGRLGARLRGPRARVPRAAARRSRPARALPRAVRADHGRRAPGHEPGPARADRSGRERQPVHGRRRPAVDLRFPSRRRRAVRAARRAAGAASAPGPTLDTNFRSRPEILERHQRSVREGARRAIPAAASGSPGGAGGRERRRAARRRQGRGLGDGGSRRAVAGGRGARARGRASGGC